MSRIFVVAALGVLVLSAVASAAEPVKPTLQVSPAPAAAAAISIPHGPISNGPRSSTPASSPFTHMNFSLGFGSAGFDSTVPLGSTAGRYQGRAGETTFSAELYGRRFGFNVDAAANMGTVANSSDNAVMPHTKVSAFQARGSAGTMVFASRSTTVTAGAALELRANAVASVDAGNAFLSSWQSAIAGADVHARVFLSPRVFVSAAGFAGVIPVVARWQSHDVTTLGHQGSGSLSNASVFAGSAAISMRKSEKIAFTAGIAARDAQFHLDDNSLLAERTIKPYVEMEFLY